MDAIEYLKEKRRMGCYVSPFEEENPDRAVQLVEEWSKEHAQKTNAQKFEEVFGKPVVADEAGYRCAPWVNDCIIRECGECGEWWDEPYQAPDRGVTIVKEKERWNQMKD